MDRLLRSALLMIALSCLMGTLCLGIAAAAEKADKKVKGSKSGAVTRSLNEKLVDEEAALDDLTVAGESDSTPCVTCEPSDPLIQDKVAVPVPGSSGSTMSFTAQGEARAAGARMPAMTNPNINFFQSLR